MATKRVQIKTGARRVTLDALRQKVADAEEALQNAEAEEGSVEDLGDGNPNGDTHIHIHTSGEKPAGETNDDGEEDPAASGGDINARITAIEQSITQLTETVAKLAAGGGESETADDGQGDPESDVDGGPADEESVATGDDGNPFAKKDDKSGKTMDSAALEKGYATLLAKAEVLVPGFRVPTFDAKAKRKTTVDSMCSLRRKVVDAAYMTKDGATLINGITGRDSLNLVKMGCADVAVLFNAASAAKAAINNAGATRDSAKAEPATAKGLPSIAEINKANKEFWAKQGAPR